MSFASPPRAAAAIDDATTELARDTYRMVYEMLAQIAVSYIDEAEQSSIRAERDGAGSRGAISDAPPHRLRAPGGQVARPD
jgi:hypothetical protein